MEIPEEAFADIIAELQARPLYVNLYRLSSGVGRSQAFGIVNRRSLPPDYSRWCWKRPRLYKLLLDFAEKYVSLPFTSITVNQNYCAEPHRDKNNVGKSFLVAFGNFFGGQLKIHEGELEGMHFINRRPIIADFSKITHSVLPFQGERFSLVFYTNKSHRKDGLTREIPPPRVVEEDGVWKFYRGDVWIDPKKGLPDFKRAKRGAAHDASEPPASSPQTTTEPDHCV